MTNSKSTKCLGYLLEGAELQDNLLQGYRNFHLTLQSIFIAIGTGLSIAILAFKEVIQFALATLILIVLSIISVYILIKMHRIIIERGKDVNFWHRELIKAEQDLPPDRRYFTRFKIHQKLHRADIDHIQKLFLSESEISEQDIKLLVDKGLGHTRKILDKWLFVGIGIIWILLVAISIVFSVYRYINLQ